ncbi:hypothetical protein DY240_25010, partial [Jiangella rhizosphaerae]
MRRRASSPDRSRELRPLRRRPKQLDADPVLHDVSSSGGGGGLVVPGGLPPPGPRRVPPGSGAPGTTDEAATL